MTKSAFFKGEGGLSPSKAPTGSARPVVDAGRGPFDVDIQAHATGAAPGTYLRTSQSLNNGWRFPSSRKYLWDRTPMGATEYLQPREHMPSITVPSNAQHILGTSKVLARFATGGAMERQLEVTLASGLTQYNPSEDHAMVPLQQPSDVRDQRGQQDFEPLKHMFQHGLDRRGAAQMSQRVAMSCSLQPGVGASATLLLNMLLPVATLTMTPLYSKRLCDVPLAQSLAMAQPGAGPPAQTGYLTLDQARSVLPLLPDDPSVYSVPLVGIWIRAVRSLDHPLVYAACLKFFFSSVLPDRAVQADGCCLVLIFGADSPIPKCYEARFLDQDQGLQLVPHTASVELAGQTNAPLVVKPVQDTLGLAMALQPISPVPSRPAASPYRAGRIAGGASMVSADAEHERALLRGSGSKLMTSPSKAMKVVAPPKGGPSQAGSVVAALGGGMDASAAQYGLMTRESPPMPRGSFLPTPFRPVGGDGAAAANAVGGAAPARDPHTLPYNHQQGGAPWAYPGAVAPGGHSAASGQAPPSAYWQAAGSVDGVMPTPGFGVQRYGAAIATPGPQFAPWGHHAAHAAAVAAQPEAAAQQAYAAIKAAPQPQPQPAGPAAPPYRGPVNESLDAWLRDSRGAAQRQPWAASVAGPVAPTPTYYEATGLAGGPTVASASHTEAGAPAAHAGSHIQQQQQQHAHQQPGGVSCLPGPTDPRRQHGADGSAGAGDGAAPAPAVAWEQHQHHYGSQQQHAAPAAVAAATNDSDAQRTAMQGGAVPGAHDAGTAPQALLHYPALVDGMPTDPAALQAEVVRLQRQVQELQQHLSAFLAGHHGPSSSNSSAPARLPGAEWQHGPPSATAHGYGHHAGGPSAAAAPSYQHHHQTGEAHMGAAPSQHSMYGGAGDYVETERDPSNASSHPHQGPGPQPLPSAEPLHDVPMEPAIPGADVAAAATVHEGRGYASEQQHAAAPPGSHWAPSGSLPAAAPHQQYAPAAGIHAHAAPSLQAQLLAQPRASAAPQAPPPPGGASWADADHMSVSGMSERGSVWSMASLKSSIASGQMAMAGTPFRSTIASSSARQRPPGHQRRRSDSSSADGSDAQSVESLDAGPSAAAAAAPPALRKEPARSPGDSLKLSVDIVRTKYVPMDDDTDSSDSDMEAMLMQKYGIKGA